MSEGASHRNFGVQSENKHCTIVPHPKGEWYQDLNDLASTFSGPTCGLSPKLARTFIWLYRRPGLIPPTRSANGKLKPWCGDIYTHHGPDIIRYLKAGAMGTRIWLTGFGVDQIGHNFKNRFRKCLVNVLTCGGTRLVFNNKNSVAINFQEV